MNRRRAAILLLPIIAALSAIPFVVAHAQRVSPLPAPSVQPPGSQSQSTTASRPSDAPLPGRYQLVSAQVLMQQTSSMSLPAPMLFLIDSQTGKVWQFYPQRNGKSPDGREFLDPDRFEPILMDSTDEAGRGSRSYSPK